MHRIGVGCLLVILLGAAGRDAAAQSRAKVRFATFNASLNRGKAGGLIEDLRAGDPQARDVAEVIQRANPDVLLVNEFDYDPYGTAAQLFHDQYLAASQRGVPPVKFPYRYVPPVNTGVSTGLDLDGDGEANGEAGSRGYGNDCYGYGLFPGQYGMVLYSKHPIDSANVATFRELRWADFPGAKLPEKPDGSPWYSADALRVLRLSSKTHADVPIAIGGWTIHTLISHPTPPAFDGPEHRNGHRNRDEVAFWSLYLGGRPGREALKADGGKPCPSPPESFVILGDLNADPADGGSFPGGIDGLLAHPRVDSAFVPRSDGAVEAASAQGGANERHKGDPQYDTADFSDRQPGNLRVDYVLPSKGLKVLGGEVSWPKAADPLGCLVAMDPEPATSDHRLVFIDLEVAPTQP